MNVYAISDLHLSFSSDKPMDIFGGSWDNYWQKICEDWSSKVEADDIVLIAGDISWAMSLENAMADLKEIAKLKGKKIFIKGNHDYWWSSLSKIRAVLPEGMYILQNDAIKFDNVVIAGSRLWNLSNQNSEDKKINAREAMRLEMSLKKAEDITNEGDCLIAMCHFPPFDAFINESEYTRLFEKYKVQKVVYGHLHGKDCRAVKCIHKNGIDYYLTSCDQVENKLVKII